MPKSLISFQTFNDDESAHYLADHWPKGKLTGKRHDSSSVIYKFILSLATFIKIFTGDLFTLVKNRDISKAEELLEEWETSVKIPDEIPSRDTLSGRREAVECLISKIPVYNIDNGVVSEKSTFEHYIECLTGIEVTIRTAQVDGDGSQFPLVFPFQFGIGSAIGGFLWIIEVPVSGDAANNFFPLPFPVQFFTPSVPQATMELLDTILERVVPSFCRWEYEAVTS